MRRIPILLVSIFAGVLIMCISCSINPNSSAGVAATDQTDPYLWLENVTGQKSLDWANAQNAITHDALQTSPDFIESKSRILAIANSKDLIPEISKYGPYLYNFWQDSGHIRGIWRRTTLDEYKKTNPTWETVLDLDALAKAEKENWAWKGVNVFQPTCDKCLIELSRGGADAEVIREFDLLKKDFVADGFQLPESKVTVAWRNSDSLYMGIDFGPGSMTTSGYPRIIKQWERGTPLTDAKTVFEGKSEDVGIDAYGNYDHGHRYEFIERGITFFTSELRLRLGDDWVKVDRPEDADVTVFDGNFLIRLKTDWKINGQTYPGGSVLATNIDSFLHGAREFALLFDPHASYPSGLPESPASSRRFLQSIETTQNYVILNETQNVNGRVEILRKNGPTWSRTDLETPSHGAATARGLDPEKSDEYLIETTDFLTPTTLSLGIAGTPQRERLKSLPAFFDTTGLSVEQHEIISKDGTHVPYFQVGKKNLKLDGNNPTLLYGYGGFQISEEPRYSAAIGAGWLEKGGIFVLANIRGGGEFGPEWHEAARKQNRQHAYDDFIAVAEDLIARKVTSQKHLGIQGGSNGGLLMGVMLTERPDLWGAVLCQAPLLDMRRYSKLLAGASWIDEYGNPDKPEEWSYIRQYSPYQNVKPGVKYPPVLFMTSTRDDRVHPGHARKMAALMESLGNPVLFYENIEGGHQGSVNNDELAFDRALGFSFLWKELQ